MKLHTNSENSYRYRRVFWKNVIEQKQRKFVATYSEKQTHIFCWILRNNSLQICKLTFEGGLSKVVSLYSLYSIPMCNPAFFKGSLTHYIDFRLQVFFTKFVSPWPQSILLRSFQIFTIIRGGIYNFVFIRIRGSLVTPVIKLSPVTAALAIIHWSLVTTTQAITCG